MTYNDWLFTMQCSGWTSWVLTFVWVKLETYHPLQTTYTPSQQHNSPIAMLDGSVPSPTHGGAVMNLVPASPTDARSDWVCQRRRCHQWVPLPWGCVLRKQLCLGGWRMSRGICLNIRTWGFPAEHCIVMRLSVLSTSPVSPFTVVPDPRALFS